MFKRRISIFLQDVLAKEKNGGGGRGRLFISANDDNNKYVKGLP